MRCRVREEVRIRRNEMIEEVKYFRCWGVGHFKWECPNIEVEKKRKRNEEACYREVVNASVITLDGCSRRTRWSSLLDCSPTYTTVTVAVP